MPPFSRKVTLLLMPTVAMRGTTTLKDSTTMRNRLFAIETRTQELRQFTVSCLPKRRDRMTTHRKTKPKALKSDYALKT